jgi:hypothetical protein
MGGTTQRGGKNKESNPGPGAYDGATSFVGKPKTVAFDIGKASRKGHNSISDAPGPGMYENKKLTMGPSHAFGQKRHSRIESSPGPGAYDDDDLNKVRGPAIGLGKAQGRSDIVPKQQYQSPGPGSYSNNKGMGGGGFTIGNKGRDVSRENSPGPGAYELKSGIQYNKNLGRGMSKTPRGNLMSKSALENPAPGAYNHSPHKGGPSFTFSQTQRK